MTAEQRSLALWAGIAGLLVVAGWVWMAVRGGEASAAAAEMQASQRKLAASFMPDRPDEGTRLAMLAKGAAEGQERALRTAEEQLLAVLPDDYSRRLDLPSASRRVRDDAEALRQRAERERIGWPSAFPFDQGLSAEDAQRSLELAQLYCCRLAAERCLAAPVLRLERLAVGKSAFDPSRSYAVLTADLEADLAADALGSLLREFREAHARGLGLRALAVELRDAKAGLLRVRLTAGLLLRPPAEHAWKLGGLAGAPAGAGVPAAPGATPPPPPPPQPRPTGGLGGKAPSANPAPPAGARP